VKWDTFSAVGTVTYCFRYFRVIHDHGGWAKDMPLACFPACVTGQQPVIICFMDLHMLGHALKLYVAVVTSCDTIL
jgi:hypothetical protein